MKYILYIYIKSEPTKGYVITKKSLLHFGRAGKVVGEAICYTYTNSRRENSPPHNNCFFFCNQLPEF